MEGVTNVTSLLQSLQPVSKKDKFIKAVLSHCHPQSLSCAQAHDVLSGDSPAWGPISEEVGTLCDLKGTGQI